MLSKFLTIILFLTVSGLAVFGLPAMGHSLSDHRIGGCFGAIPEKAVCPESLGPIGLVNFHIGLFSKIFRVIPLSAGLLLVALLALAFLRKISGTALSLSGLKIFGFSYLNGSRPILAPCRILYQKWLAIFGKRDPEVCAFSGANLLLV